MRNFVATCAAILTLTLALAFTVGAQTDSTPEADATPELLCATPLAELEGTPADHPAATVIASPEGGSPVVVVPCATPGSSPVTGDEQPPAGLTMAEVVMVDISFEPTQFTIPADTDVTIQLVNNGVLPHNFAVPSEGIQSEDFASGASGSITVNLPAGTYEFICSVPGHADAGMRGMLTVE